MMEFAGNGKDRMVMLTYEAESYEKALEMAAKAGDSSVNLSGSSLGEWQEISLDGVAYVNGKVNFKGRQQVTPIQK